jgi:hypothetical protein
MERWIVVWRIELEAPMILFPFPAGGLYQEWGENARKMAGFLRVVTTGAGAESRRQIAKISALCLTPRRLNQCSQQSLNEFLKCRDVLLCVVLKSAMRSAVPNLSLRVDLFALNR